jgi:tetratricopeptide (TPR) repeat protein
VLGEPDERSLSAAADLALARLALDTGDEHHAAEHVAAAIVQAPTLPEVHEVLAQLAARDDGGIELFPVDGPVSIGTAVARGHLLAAAGRPAEGLRLLAAASAYVPTTDWAGVPWTQDPELPRRVEPDDLARIFLQLCGALPEPVAAADRPPLRPYLRLARHSVRAYPAHGLLHGAASALARRMGETALAVRWAEAGVRAEPSKLGEMWLGYAHRSAGRVDPALEALQRAVAYDPDDLAVYADIAGTLADADRLGEALDWAQHALDRDPSYDCAVHTVHRLRYRRDGQVDHLVALADFQRHHRDDSHEHTELADCCAGRPWLGQLPRAGEAGISVLRQLQAAAEPMGDARLRLTALEPPSAMRTLATALPELDVRVTAAPAPDIRRPRRGEESILWRYDGLTAAPAVPAPSARAADCLLRVARPAWPHPPAAYDHAVELAAVPLDDLLGLLAHPPDPPPGGPAAALADGDLAQWTRCVQVWTCLGLLHHQSDEPWPDSTRRRVLVDLAWDVEDWVTEAAVFALVVAAWVDAGARTDVAHLVAERLADAAAVTRQRPVTVGWSLGQLALATPGLDPATRRQAKALLGAGEEAKPLPRARRPLAFVYPGRLSRRRHKAAQAAADIVELAGVGAPAAGSDRASADQPGAAEPAGPRRPGRLLRWFIRRR